MREKHFGVVHAGEPQEVILAHLAQLFAIGVLEHGRVDLQQPVLFNGPVQPLADVVLGPQRRVCPRRDRKLAHFTAIQWRLEQSEVSLISDSLRNEQIGSRNVRQQQQLYSGLFVPDGQDSNKLRRYGSR